MKLLKELNPNKASGPDKIPCRVLKELATELAPVVTAFFRQTAELCVFPRDWTEAIISPIYKKGNVHLASNYRPVSLTCVIEADGTHYMQAYPESSRLAQYSITVPARLLQISLL